MDGWWMERIRTLILRVKNRLRVTGKEGKVRRGWWDRECEESRGNMQRYNKGWRKGQISEREYNQRQKLHEKLLREKKEKERLKFLKEVEKAVVEVRE